MGLLFYVLIFVHRYLQYSLMDQELLSMKNFEVYVPVDSEGTTFKEKSAFIKNQHMVRELLVAIFRSLDNEVF